MGIQSKYTTVKEIMNLKGFYLTHTGGNCTAYEHILENGDSILIADDNSAPENISDICVVGLYDNEGNELSFWEDMEGIESALHAAKFYVSEYYADKEQDEHHILSRG